MAAWPLSAQLLFGLEDDPGDPRLRSDMRRGPPKQRRDSTTSLRRVRGEVSISGTDVATLWTFGKTTLLEWSDPFTWEDPQSDATVTYRFASVPRRRLLLGGTTAARRWLVSLELEVLP